MSNPAYHHGDLLLVSLPFADVVQSKVRPVLLVQNDIANKVSGNLIVAAISSHVPQRLLPVQYKVAAGSSLAQEAGLVRDSVVDCGVIYTIAKSRVRRKIGALPPDAMAEIDSRLKISLALA
ncbi:MAG: type II toxin-antitoxin system PemK/MazF family toxin [Anaerolineae bacterium]